MRSKEEVATITTQDQCRLIDFGTPETYAKRNGTADTIVRSHIADVVDIEDSNAQKSAANGGRQC